MSDTKTTYIMPDQNGFGNNDIATLALLGGGAGDAARKTGFKLSGINKVVCGYGKTYKGYKWIREEKS